MKFRSFSQAYKKSKIVLGVDDAADNLIVLRKAVESEGFPFVGVRSGGECLALLGRIVPRFILLDVQIPRIDGLEICRRPRRMPGLTTSPSPLS